MRESDPRPLFVGEPRYHYANPALNKLRALREIRTPGLLVRSQTLYPLSYKGNLSFSSDALQHRIYYNF